MKNGMNDKGGVKWIIILFFFICAVFLAISFGRPYYRYNTLRSHTKDLLLSQVTDIDRIRKEVLDDAVELKVPLKDEDLEVSVTKGTQIIHVRASWTDTVDLLGYYQKDIDFDMDVEY
jgi:hypothetical protein